MRVVSLVPSVTETLLAWGVTPVAVTRFCEQPSLPAVGGTKDPDVDAIVALAPDVVVVDEEENRREDAAALEAAGLSVHVTAVRSLADVGPTLAGLAAAVQRPAATLARPDAGELGLPRLGVRAFVPIWRRPWMSVNRETYGASLLAVLGVETVAADAADRYPQMTLDEAAAAGAQVVIAPSEPYPFGERHREELAAVAPVVFVDGRDLFWWGVRTPGAALRLAATLAAALER